MVCCRCRTDYRPQSMIPYVDRHGIWDGVTRRHWCFYCWSTRTNADAPDSPTFLIPKSQRTRAQDKVFLKLTHTSSVHADGVYDKKAEDIINKSVSDYVITESEYPSGETPRHRSRDMHSSRSRTPAYVPDSKIDSLKNEYTFMTQEREQEYLKTLHSPPSQPLHPRSDIEQTSSVTATPKPNEDK